MKRLSMFLLATMLLVGCYGPTMWQPVPRIRPACVYVGSPYYRWYWGDWRYTYYNYGDCNNWVRLYWNRPAEWRYHIPPAPSMVEPRNRQPIRNEAQRQPERRNPEQPRVERPKTQDRQPQSQPNRQPEGRRQSQDQRRRQPPK